MNVLNMSFDATCDQPSSLFYNVYIEGSRPLTKEEIIKKAFLFEDVDIRHAYNYHVAFENIYTPNNVVTI